MLTRRAVLCGGGAGLAVALAGCGDATDMRRYDEAARMIREPGHAGLVDCVRYATLAPNGHNTQPWRFALSARSVDILPDLSRRTPVVDPDDHHLWASLGCAAENFLIAARAQSLHGDVRFDPAGGARAEPSWRRSFRSGRSGTTRPRPGSRPRRHGPSLRSSDPPPVHAIDV